MPLRTEAVMGTLVTIQVLSENPAASAAMDCAFSWFHEIERCCTRFDERSELMQLAAHPGEAVPVSSIVFEAVQFAVKIAEETGGAFDPAIGHRMYARGFNREHRTGAVVRNPSSGMDDVSYRDIELDAEGRTITLKRPMTLDLGAVAKGLAVDMAARELEPWRNFAIDAGGDLFLGGKNASGAPWSVGIRHPKDEGLIESLRISGQAVCTSGDYERRTGDGEHHIMDPRTGASPRDLASVTVIASGAMLADALATAAFVMGPRDGIDFLGRMGVEGLIFTQDLVRYETRGLRRAA